MFFKSSIIILLPILASIITGALIFPEVIFGKTEASKTHKLFNP